MKQMMTILQVMLLLAIAVGVASATELNLSSETDSAMVEKNVELTLVAAPANVASHAPDTENELPPELEPALLRERAFTEANAFAGVQVALPTSPLSIVFAADELLNPTCGLKLHLVW